jgi:glycogen synthase
VSHLLVVTPRELTGDPRARRQVLAARAHGYDVTGLCIRLPGEEAAELDGVPIVRVPAGRVSDRLRGAGLGGMRRSTPPVRELRGLFRLARLRRTTQRLEEAARELGPFDIVHANDFDALAAGHAIARRSGAKLVYDAHELYAHMEADPPRLYRAIASRQEARLAREGTVVTNCDLFARELDRSLALERSAVVVLNCPDRAELVPHAPGERLRVIYQAAGSHEGRPVEDLLAAAEHAPDVDVAVRVIGVDVPRDGRVEVLDPVPVDQAVEALSGFDVGVTVDRPLTPNTELSVPGKIFEYMMAGLAVVVPRLPGVTALVEGERIGLTYEPGNPKDLARALRELDADRDRLAAMRARARELALERFNAETQAEALVRVWAS